MNIKFLSPFVEAAAEVMQAEAQMALTRGELTLEKTPYFTDEVTVIISIVGAIEGNVFYSLNEKMVLELVARMLGEPLARFDTLAQSGIAELGNVITGRASVKLHRLGYEVVLSPPALLLGKGVTLSTLDLSRLIVPLTSPYGVLRLHLAVREAPAHPQMVATALQVPPRPKAS